jgi:hypothetical protein
LELVQVNVAMGLSREPFDGSDTTRCVCRRNDMPATRPAKDW